MAPGTALVTDRRRARRHWMEAEAALGAHLAARHLAGILAMYRANVVLDVGANRGQFGRRLRAYGYRGHIVSFEPVPRAFAGLERRAARDGRWTAHPYALGEAEGTVTMRVVRGTMSSVLAPTDFGARRYGQFADAVEEEVPVRRLDAVLDEVLAHVPEPRTFLKLDTQGFDLPAFRGLGDRAGELVGLQSEVAFQVIYEGTPRIAESLAVYEAAGFEVSGLFHVSRQSATARLVEMDCVMVRADAR
jgi:FkbM family methyltransferase